MESCRWYKTLRETAHSEVNVKFLKKGNFSLNQKGSQVWSLFFGTWKHNKSVFFLSITNWVKMFTDLLFYALVGIYQVRILVFDNSQRCTVPLDKLYWLSIISKVFFFYEFRLRSVLCVGNLYNYCGSCFTWPGPINQCQLFSRHSTVWLFDEFLVLTLNTSRVEVMTDIDC